jgi:hypothetical protein
VSNGQGGILVFTANTNYTTFHGKFVILARSDGNFRDNTVISFDVLGAGAPDNHTPLVYNISKNRIGNIALISDPTVSGAVNTIITITVVLPNPIGILYSVVCHKYSWGGLVSLTQDSTLVKTW